MQEEEKSELQEMRRELSGLRQEVGNLKVELQAAKEELCRHFDTLIGGCINTFHTFEDIKLDNPDVKLVHKINTILLYELKKVCDKHHIEYWIASGTLLGAARHQGFIPWDDDLDVGMTRENVSKLLKVMENHPHFKIKTYFSFSGTEAVQFGFRNFNPRILIDIFTFDFTDFDDKDAYAKQLIKCRGEWVREINKIRTSAGIPRWNKKDLHLSPEVLKALDQSFEKVKKAAGVQPDGQYVVEMTYANQDPYRQIHEKSTVFPLGRAVFEGTEYPAPRNIEKYLRTIFKNYMLFPADVSTTRHIPFCTYEQISLMREAAAWYESSGIREMPCPI